MVPDLALEETMSIHDVVWPRLHPMPNAMLLALLHEFEKTQYMPREQLLAGQLAQLRKLAAHHFMHNKPFAKRMTDAGLSPSDLTSMDALRRVPVLQRYDIQTASKDWFTEQIPYGHGMAGTTKTSGSSGEPVVVRKTQISALFWGAHAVRDHLWWRRDFAGSLCAIRADIKQTNRHPNWGPPASEIYDTGPAMGMFNGMDIEEQLEIVTEFQPDVLLIYPNNLHGFLDIWLREGYGLTNLKHVKTIGETVHDDLRARTLAVTGLRIEDNYSSNECGTMAIQCPDSGMYHEMSETVIFEIIKADGTPAAPGEEGRVVVTDLHNFATPLIRYQINDWAVQGPDEICSCGRTLPLIQRIIGREHSIMTRPDGSRHWPMFQGMRFAEVAPVRQYQVIQHSRTEVELKVFTDEPITAEQEQGLIKLVQGGLGWPYDMRVTQYRQRLPLTAAGKFQEFICKVV